MAKVTPGKEYERKFIARVKKLPRDFLKAGYEIEQGYLALAPNSIRIRLKKGLYVVELKGGDDDEVEICRPSKEEGDYLLRVIAPKVADLVRKTRSEAPASFDGLVWEIDVFADKNAPLVLVEIEMPSKGYPLEDHEWPEWVGAEVSKDQRFKNKNLAKRPFCTWPKAEQKKVLKLMGL